MLRLSKPGDGQLVDIGEAVGVIAAQSIGEPGTPQLEEVDELYFDDSGSADE